MGSQRAKDPGGHQPGQATSFTNHPSLAHGSELRDCLGHRTLIETTPYTINDIRRLSCGFLGALVRPPVAVSLDLKKKKSVLDKRPSLFM